MSKMDALRAMREAKYEAAKAGTRTASPRVQPKTPAAAQQTAPKTRTAAPKAPVEQDEAPSGLCGHRSMNGRTCTREHGHAAKSHRYS
jgi:hypothetical protein